MSSKTFKFDRSQFRFEYVGLKALSKATISPTIAYVNSGGQLVKTLIPTAIARTARKALHNVSRFTNAYPICLAFVDNRIVSIDVAVEKDYKMFIEYGEWISKIELHEHLLDQIPMDALWDGQYAYTINHAPEPLGTSGFGSQKTKCYNLFRLTENKSDISEEMIMFCFKNPKTGEWHKSTPVARSSGGFLQLGGDVDVISSSDRFIDVNGTIDDIDQKRFVNLRFVNLASRVLSRSFGYESIEPLGLPLLMIEHRTFNVGGLSIPVQSASPAPLKFTQAMAWLVGLYTKVNTLDDMMCIKQTFKMLLTKGSSFNYMESGEGEAKETKSRAVLISDLRKKMNSAALVSFD